jgi:hypothetical protein
LDNECPSSRAIKYYLRRAEHYAKLSNLYRQKIIVNHGTRKCVHTGGLSQWQMENIHGGAYLPIIAGLQNELDLIHPQYYNAGGAQGGTIANDGQVYYDTGDPDYLTAITRL